MKKLFFLLCAIIALSSCTHYYYTPSSPCVPLFKEKNEVRATGSIGTGDETDTKTAQVAYSLTNHLAISANYMEARGGNFDSKNGARGNYKDISLGYFRPVRDRFVFEVFTGYGYSNQLHHYSEDESAQLSFQKYFIQPSFGLTTEFLDIAVTPTFSRLSFQHIQSNVYSNSFESAALAQISDRRTSILFEPTLTMRAGWQFIKLQGQMGVSRNLTHKGLAFEKKQIHAGISFAFAERMLKKNKRARAAEGAMRVNVGG